jgi:lipoyl-dependent peroxiredoxin
MLRPFGVGACGGEDEMNGDTAAGLGDTGRAVRQATVTWLTHPPRGLARVGVGSVAFSALPLAFSGEDPDPKVTSPGELLTAAHCGAFAVVLARILERNGTQARELTVDGAYTFEGEWYAVTDRSFEVRARVEGSSADAFEQAAHEALEQCAESLGLAGADDVQVTTELLPA